ARSTAWEFYTNPIILEFLLGIGVYQLTLNISVKRENIWPVAFVLIGCLLLLPCLELWFGVAYRYLFLGVPAAALVLCAVFLERSGCLLRNSVLLLIGNASYVLYLTHPYVLQLGEKALRFNLVQSLAGRVAAGIMLVVLALVVACAVHLNFEKPVMRILKRWL